MIPDRALENEFTLYCIFYTVPYLDKWILYTALLIEIMQLSPS
jgi:hypothetical protein